MRKFLTAFAAVAAGFASQNSPAAIAGASSPSITSALQNDTVKEDEALKAEDGLVSVVDEKGNEFSFVLKRSSETGAMMAYHSSHSSHRSHASHSSHYSSR